MSRLGLLMGLAALLVSAVAVGQVRRPRVDTIDVSEIQPGMRGYGLTVFRGTRPERFDVEVIDVLHNFRPDQHLILIRTPHPLLDEAHVVAGMSGSPIYLDNRLAGAYAYGWPFSQNAIAGVTPIRNMLVEMRRPVHPDAFPGAQPLASPRARRRARRATLRPNLHGLPPYLGLERVSATSALEAHAARTGLGARSEASPVPAATPVMLGGFDDSVVRMLDEQLGGFGLMSLQAGGAGQPAAPATPPGRYVNGGAVGVSLVRGDIAATAVGTVTHVEGHRAVAFGHPMLNAGQPGLPTTLVRVLHILSSVSRSFKISEPLSALGTLVHDRQSGVVVDDRVNGATVPVRLRVLGVPDAPRNEWSFEVASHRILTPVLLNASINNALKATAADNADVTFVATSRLWVEGRAQPIEVVDRGYSRIGPANPAALRQLRVFSLLSAVYGNPFEVARAGRLEIDLAVTFGRSTVQIVDASVASSEVDPGSTVPVRVTLRRWSQPEEVRTVQLRIPERLAGETLQVRIEGGDAVSVEHPQPEDLTQVLSNVQQGYPATSMMVSVRTPQRGLRFAGHVVRHLPRSALDTLQLRNDSDRNRPFITYDRHEVDLGAVVGGNARVDLTVRETPRP